MTNSVQSVEHFRGKNKNPRQSLPGDPIVFQLTEDGFILGEIFMDRQEIINLDPAEFRDAAECEAAIGELDVVLAGIKRKLDDARATAVTTGDFSDPNWFNRTQYALRRISQKRNQLQTRYGQLNREARRRFATTLGQAFIETARKRLPPELFSEIHRAAKEIAEQP